MTGPKRHALLALLALRGGRVVSVEVLVDAVWGEQVPAAPRNAVQHHVSRLRAALGAESIVAAPDGYALAGATVDALGFEELLARARSAGRAGDAGQAAELVARGLGLWRGRPLQGLPDSAWVGAEAARLEGLRTTRWRSSSRRRWRWGAQRGVGRIPGPGRAPVPGAAVGPADAGPVSQRPPGRGAGSLRAGPAGPGRAAGGRAGAGAAAAAGGDPGPRPCPGQRPRRGCGAAGSSAGTGDLVGGSPAGPGRGGRAGWEPAAGDPDRSARGRQEPPCPGGGAGGGARLRRWGVVRRACPRRAARRCGPGGGAHARCPGPGAKP